MRLMRLKKIVLTGSCALLISGCGKIRYPNYYSLSLPPAPPSLAQAVQQPATLAVRKLETPAYLRQGRIVYRENPNQIGFYEYHRWATDPGATVTTAVIDSLRSSHLFASVGPYDSQQRPDYILTGRLERLDEIDDGGGVRVEARLSAELTNLRTGAVVWTGDASETSNVDQRNVNSVVAEMSTALQASIQRLVASMQEQVSSAETERRQANR
jgi:cholesterol transport system auxiliary component